MTDIRLAAISEARLGRPELFRAALEYDALRRPSWNTLAACEVAGQRFHQRGFTAYEGLLEQSQNVQSLRGRFGMHHQFSATELEAYARCPFQFWLANVLKIGVVESPEEGTDYAARGTLLHEVVSQLLIEGFLGDPSAMTARFRELVDSLLDRHFPETDLQRALVKVERLTLSQWADAFAQQVVEYDSKIGEIWKPSTSMVSEIPFGKLPDSSADEREAYPAIPFGTEAKSVNVRGRVDRVDLGTVEGHPAYIVVDYKTGQRPSSTDDDLVTGRSMQLALYLLAVKRLGLVGANATPLQMGYWVLHDTGFKPGSGGSKLKRLDPAKVNWMESVLDRLLPQLADEIRSGRFVVENSDVHCTGRCPYRTVCRVNQIRPIAESLGKQSPPRQVENLPGKIQRTRSSTLFNWSLISCWRVKLKSLRRCHCRQK